LRPYGPKPTAGATRSSWLTTGPTMRYVHAVTAGLAAGAGDIIACADADTSVPATWLPSLVEGWPNRSETPVELRASVCSSGGGVRASPEAVWVLWAGIHRVAVGHPQSVSPFQGEHVADAVLDHQERRTGAGCFVGSGAVGDDRLRALAELLELAFQNRERDEEGPRDMSFPVLALAAYVDYSDRVSIKEHLELFQLHSRNAVRRRLCRSKRRQADGQYSRNRKTLLRHYSDSRGTGCYPQYMGFFGQSHPREEREDRRSGRAGGPGEPRGAHP
jgi:hypothetical protein